MSPLFDELRASTPQIVRSPQVFKPGQSRQYLYIAKERGGPADEFKVGKTLRAPAQRMRELRGQSSVEFDLVAAYEVLNATDAEGWAFLKIDEASLRKYPDTRRELVRCPLPQLTALCEQAVQASLARSKERQRQQQAMMKVLGLTVAQDTPSLVPPAHSRRFWLDAFAWRLTFQGRSVPLGTLMAQAATQLAAREKLEKLGLQCCFVDGRAIGFELNWSQAKGLVHHLFHQGHCTPALFESVVKFKLRAARSTGPKILH